MKLYDCDGQPMVDAKEIELDGDKGLKMQCTIMGAYDMDIFIDPYEVYHAKDLLSKDVVKRLLKMFKEGKHAEPRPAPESDFVW